VITTIAKDKAEAAFKTRTRLGESAKIQARIQADRFAAEEKIERLKSLRLARAAAEPKVSKKP
jgi:hypothetical protein